MKALAYQLLGWATLGLGVLLGAAAATLLVASGGSLLWWATAALACGLVVLGANIANPPRR